MKLINLSNFVNSSNFVYSAQKPKELGITEKKIRNYAKLKKGWDFGRGAPIKKSIRDQALTFCHYLKQRGLFRTDAYPDPNGGIMITINQNDDYLEFSFQPNQTITFVHEKNKAEQSYIADMNFEDAVEELKKYGKSIWSSSESSIHNFTTSTKPDLLVKHFSTEMMTQYQ